MTISGMPVRLSEFPASCLTNRRFADFDLSSLDRLFLPRSMQPLWDASPLAEKEFLEDDNRSAILPDPIATLDGEEFYLSVKGIGSTVDPYSWKPLGKGYASELTNDPEVRERLRRPQPDPAPPSGGEERMITGELWLRGSPYGGQGLLHAENALRISERADLTSLEGFRIAPVVKVARFPPELEERVRTIHWYRRYPGHLAQELRLVPSNVRVYFHARRTIGHDVRAIYDQFSVNTPARALRFETHFLRSTVAMLTLFARTLERDGSEGRYRGLDFMDVWLDKDAVLAPSGTAYFVDLEGIEEVRVDRDGVREKIEDQVYRSLYELTFAYEQLETERIRRFGPGGSRKEHFVRVLQEAVKEDPFVRLAQEGSDWMFTFRNKGNEEDLFVRFPAVSG